VQIRVYVAVLAMSALALAGCSDDTDSTTPAEPTSSTAGSHPPINLDATPPSADTSDPAPDTATTLRDAVDLADADAFPILVPSAIPDGWSVTAAGYGTLGRGTWELTMTDDRGGEVVIRQALPDVPSSSVAEIETLLGTGARASGAINLVALGRYVRYEGKRHRIYAAGRFSGTKVVLWADNEPSLGTLADTLTSS
jgi:ABC-type Fe3+-hydroxamate transport system substrate-binding protein